MFFNLCLSKKNQETKIGAEIVQSTGSLTTTPVLASQRSIRDWFRPQDKENDCAKGGKVFALKWSFFLFLVKIKSTFDECKVRTFIGKTSLEQNCDSQIPVCLYETETNDCCWYKKTAIFSTAQHCDRNAGKRDGLNIPRGK